MNTLRSIFATAVLACATILPAANASASSVAQKSISELASTSDMIFEGQVVGIRSETIGKKVFTYVTFEVADVVRGKYAKILSNYVTLVGPQMVSPCEWAT